MAEAPPFFEIEYLAPDEYDMLYNLYHSLPPPPSYGRAPPYYPPPPPPAGYPYYHHGSGGGRAAPGPGRFPQRVLTMDFGKGSIAFATATGVAIYGALMTGGYTHGLLAASLFVIINLGVGVHVSTTGRRHRIMAFVNFCACFIPLIITMAHGAEFKPELVKKVYDALF